MQGGWRWRSGFIGWGEVIFGPCLKAHECAITIGKGDTFARGEGYLFFNLPIAFIRKDGFLVGK